MFDAEIDNQPPSELIPVEALNSLKQIKKAIFQFSLVILNGPEQIRTDFFTAAAGESYFTWSVGKIVGGAVAGWAISRLGGRLMDMNEEPLTQRDKFISDLIFGACGIVLANIDYTAK